LTFFGCATSNDYLGHITWSSWTSTRAKGTATHDINGCHPSCAQGTYSSFPVEVHLSNPVDVGGMFVFRTITATPSSNAGASETSTAGPHGSWGAGRRRDPQKNAALTTH
jgi:hypothetical protein